MIPTSNTKKKLLKDMIQMTLHLNKNNCPNYEKIKYILNESPDLMCRTLEVGGDCLEVIFMKNLIKQEFLNEYVIKYNSTTSDRIHNLLLFIEKHTNERSKEKP